MRASLLTTLTLLILAGCGGTTAGNPESKPEDFSASGAAASAVGGALSSSGSGGTQASLSRPGAVQRLVSRLDFFPEAEATAICPTFLTDEGAGCHAAAQSMWLTYPGCRFRGSAASWEGTQELVMSGGSAACGSFTRPHGAATNTLVRQFVASSGSTTPGSVTVTSAFGTVSTIDNSAGISNFDGDAMTPILNGGYGTRITYSGVLGLVRTGIDLAHRVTIGDTTDVTLTGSLTLSEATEATERTVSGSITVYHNKLKVIGTTTFGTAANPIVHSDSCCLPVSGTITTAFRRGTADPTDAGSKYVGKTETLTLTGCGTGTLTNADGTSADVTISRCY